MSALKEHLEFKKKKNQNLLCASEQVRKPFFFLDDLSCISISSQAILKTKNIGILAAERELFKDQSTCKINFYCEIILGGKIHFANSHYTLDPEMHNSTLDWDIGMIRTSVFSCLLTPVFLSDWS